MYYMEINKNFVHQVGDQPRFLTLCRHLLYSLKSQCLFIDKRRSVNKIIRC